ncbi:MAG: DUF5320 domain-containing protein [Planctomycetota bacterium]
MPAGDGTGPMGAGPMTGRGAGYCGGLQVPGYMNSMPGRGFGMGRGRGQGRGWGRGRGRRCGWYPLGAPGVQRPYRQPSHCDAPSGEQESQALRSQAEHLEGTLDEIKRRIAELESAPGREGG